MSEMDDALGHPLPPTEVTNHQLFVMMVGLGAKIADQNRQMVAMRETIAEQGDRLDVMQETWDNAAGVLKFIKIIGTIAGAITGVVLLWKAIRG